MSDFWERFGGAGRGFGGTSSSYGSAFDGFPVFADRQRSTIEVRVKMLIDPRLCRDGKERTRVAEVDLRAAGLWICGSTINLMSGLSGNVAGVHISWCGALGGNPVDVLANLRVDVANVFLKIMMELIKEWDARDRQAGDTWKVIGLTGPVAEDQARAAYRAAAKAAHPDVGGSTEAMQRVNAAWERILDAKGWRP